MMQDWLTNGFAWLLDFIQQFFLSLLGALPDSQGLPDEVLSSLQLIFGYAACLLITAPSISGAVMNRELRWTQLVPL